MGDEKKLETPKRAIEELDQIASRPIIDKLIRNSTCEQVRDYSVPMKIREMKTHLDPADWRAGYLHVREREISWELQNDLSERVPQALLRDLFRPVYQFYPIDREPLAETAAAAALRAMVDARAAQKRHPIEFLAPSSRAFADEQQRRRQFLHDRWQPHLRDDQERPPVYVLREPSLLF